MKHRLQQLIRFRQIKAAYQTYERFFMPATLVAGLIVDFLTFRAIDINTSLLILTAHFIFAGLVIAYNILYDAQRIPQNPFIFRYARLFSQLALQFSFGALLSASFIFYWFSGEISVSWPFILVIALLMVSNDVFRKYYVKPTMQISVYFFITFSIFALALPFLFNSIDAKFFMLAGALSLLFGYGYIRGLGRYSLDIREKKHPLLLAIMLIFTLMNTAYFANLIPPIPLTLREAGVYHGVRRVGNEYIVLAEKESWLERFLPGQTIHRKTGERIYVFTSIFAPSDLNTRITHHWQYFDETRDEWVSEDKLSYMINGGRQEGYRGYSLKSTLKEGDWRVDVETQRGQIIGRISFHVEATTDDIALNELRQ